jgi:alcohol dehydrogenase
MQVGAAFAGTAIENSMLGAAHAAANPLTAQHGIVHGEAVGLMLPAVVRFNAQDSGARAAYHDLARTAGLSDSGEPSVSAEILARHLRQLLADVGLKTSLEALGIPRARIPELAAAAAQQWTGNFNPRPVAAADFERLYSAVYSA